MLGASLDHRARHGAKVACEHNVPWVPDDMWRSDFDKVSTALTQAGNALQRGLEAQAKKLGGMTVEQLEEQFKAEMIRVATKFTEADWARLDAIRMKQFTRSMRSG